MVPAGVLSPHGGSEARSPGAGGGSRVQLGPEPPVGVQAGVRRLRLALGDGSEPDTGVQVSGPSRDQGPGSASKSGTRVRVRRLTGCSESGTGVRVSGPSRGPSRGQESGVGVQVGDLDRGPETGTA